VQLTHGNTEGRKTLTRERLAKANLLVRLTLINLVILSLGTGLVVEDRRRWPILLVLGPVLLTVNYFGLRRLKRMQ